jgi:large subunit ribosomal protein L29
MKPQELRDMTADELKEKQRELTEALFNLRFQHATGQLDNTAQLKRTRGNIARVKTILLEKERAQVEDTP